MTKILIVYHSQTGHTKQMADAVVGGAKAIDGVEVILKKAADATLHDLLAGKLRLYVRHGQGFL
jgi:flavodoxin